MIEILKELKTNHNVVGVKAEFEAEGTRMEEALRLKEVITKAGLDLTIKIGGCEALKDMYDARAIGITRIVAPMIESPFALKKYIQSINSAFPKDEQTQIKFLINIETVDGVRNLDQMLEIPEIKQLGGIVLGRVDLVGSLGLPRDDVISETVFNIAQKVLSKAKQKGLECVIGGGVSPLSLPFFRGLSKGSLDYYETRKIIFKCPEALGETAEQGILKAVEFELMWLKNKRDFYGIIFNEDKNRIGMLEARYHL